MFWKILWAACGVIPEALLIYQYGVMDAWDLLVWMPICVLLGPIFPIVIFIKVFFSWIDDQRIMDKVIWRRKR